MIRLPAGREHDSVLLVFRLLRRHRNQLTALRLLGVFRWRRRLLKLIRRNPLALRSHQQLHNRLTRYRLLPVFRQSRRLRNQLVRRQHALRQLWGQERARQPSAG